MILISIYGICLITCVKTASNKLYIFVVKCVIAIKYAHKCVPITVCFGYWCANKNPFMRILELTAAISKHVL